MAQSRQQKEEAMAEVIDLLSRSKMTVFARYEGTSVKAMQELRSQSKDSGTEVKVIKNRLFKKAVGAVDGLSEASLDSLSGQLLYAFNQADEAAPAQSLAAFAKTNPQLKFAGALTADGQLLSIEDVQALSLLPTKDQLRAQLAATIAAPISGFTSVMAANVRNVLSVFSARAESI